MSEPAAGVWDAKNVAEDGHKKDRPNIHSGVSRAGGEAVRVPADRLLGSGFLAESYVDPQ
ncbi:hypothetical protein MINT15_28180 [Saccharomonospora viridis]|uniref:Uncharacterized protein n=1 Tax=Saccharomonospora viridis TaxID=1852 RepID=A0A837DA12_9PSEU|nr:hypothetical protein MINT15_28180 [Saccharomonospora viridis]